MIKSIFISILLFTPTLWAQAGKNMGCGMNEQMTGCIVRDVRFWSEGMKAKLRDGDLLKQVDEIQVYNVHQAGFALQRIDNVRRKYKKIIVNRGGQDLEFLNE